MVASVEELERAIGDVRRRIEAACGRAGRSPAGVRLIGVTKTFPPETVRRAAAAGLGDFGENRVRELIEKRPAAPESTWHFIGRLQSNKAAVVAETADWVHALEPGRAAARLARQAAPGAPPCLVEVDFAGGRVGAVPGEVPGFIDELAAQGLRVAGLATVAPLGEDPRGSFRRLRELRDRLRERHESVVELSMGMSADFEAAVEEGATMVRVGSAIFGARPPAEEA